jgi:DNA primase
MTGGKTEDDGFGEDEVLVPLLCPDEPSYGWEMSATMPGVDFRELRATVSIAEILQLIGYVPAQTRGCQLRGPCPVQRSASKTSRVFSVNLQMNAYQCFKCGSAGNQLGLYAAVTRSSLFGAAVDLCEKLNRPTPWIHRW